METPLKYIFFTVWGESLPIAWQLEKMGAEVIVGIVDDLKLVGSKETPEEHKLRVNNYKGILDVRKAEDLIERMASLKDKEEYFVFVDFNTMWRFSEAAKRLGFTKGLFPTKFDYTLENDRDMGKEFVKQFYPGVKVAPVEEFKTLEEGIEYINESEDFLALKGNDNGTSTIVPDTEDIEFARQEIIDALNGDSKGYQSKGFILEKQIRNGTELCPEAIFWDGELVATTVDLESKSVGGMNTGFKTGCAINLIREIPNDASIANIAFPEGMKKLAKRHKGMFFADMNIILKDEEYYFLEFCAARPGYDALVTEIEMSGGASAYFEAIASGESPFLRTYGAAVRALNLSESGEFKGGMSLRWKLEVEGHIWPLDLHKKDGKFQNGGVYSGLYVLTESSDDPEYAVHKTYDLMEHVSFKEPYFRSREDFLSRGYDTSLLNRNDAIENLVTPAVEGEE